MIPRRTICLYMELPVICLLPVWMLMKSVVKPLSMLLVKQKGETRIEAHRWSVSKEK